MRVNGFDIDGVIHLGAGVCGIRPGPGDVIITGRSYEEEAETLAFLRRNGIHNPVFFNQVPYEEKSRESSGWHKGETIKMLHRTGLTIQYFFEDDEVQKAEIERKIEEVSTWKIQTRVIHVNNPHVKKENRRHLEDLDG
tara:strand:+ start:21 stop:437 length:417 start_codon:yes stop_codon:yes gene_type:complete